MTSIEGQKIEPWKGWWINHDAGPFQWWQWTTTDPWSVGAGLILALLFGLAVPCFGVVIEHLLLWTNYCLRLSPPVKQSSESTIHAEEAEEDDPQDDETTPLHSRPSPKRNSFWRKKLSRFKSSTWSYRISFLIAISVVSLEAAFVIAGIFASAEPAYSSGLLNADQCAFWTLSNKASDLEQDQQDIAFQAPKERRAGSYERNCYQDSNIAKPELCTLFVKQKIPYYKSYGDPCPFADASMCLNGPLSAVSFVTGTGPQDDLVDAGLLGLNLGLQPRFRRKVTCSPVRTDGDYVTYVEPKRKCTSCQGYALWYNYGHTWDTENDGETLNHTFELPGDPFTWHTPAYNVWTFQSTPFGYDHKHDYWKPIDKLRSTDGSDKDTYMTLMLIAAGRILYRASCDDPIFPANLSYRGLWRNDKPTANVLGCVDTREVCDHKGNNCRSVHENSYSHDEPGPEFTRLAMQRSKMLDSIQFRLGTALLASERVGQYESAQLQSPNDETQTSQWIMEVEALFATSLARMQFDALDIATGLHSNTGQLYTAQPDWYKNKKLCYLMKIRLPKGYSNVNMIAYAGYLLLMLVIWILSIDLEREFETVQGEKDPEKTEYIGESVLIIDWILNKCSFSCSGRRKQGKSRLPRAAHPPPRSGVVDDEDHNDRFSRDAGGRPAASGALPPATGLAEVALSNGLGRRSNVDAWRENVVPSIGNTLPSAPSSDFALGSLAGDAEDNAADGSRSSRE